MTYPVTYVLYIYRDVPSHLRAVCAPGSLVTDDTIFSPLAISFVTFVMVYVVAALLHPQEAHLIVYGLLYILAIPSAYLLLSIYSIVNMNNVSWGTREGAATAGAAVPPPPRNKMESGSLSAFSDR